MKIITAEAPSGRNIGSRNENHHRIQAHRGEMLVAEMKIIIVEKPHGGEMLVAEIENHHRSSPMGAKCW